MRNGRHLAGLAFAIALCANVAVRATEVTSCGHMVGDGETATLAADLDCSGATVGSNGVTLGSRSTLDLRGHTIMPPASDSRGGAAVACRFGTFVCKADRVGFCLGPSGRCTITSTVGRGRIQGTGDSYGIEAVGNLVLEHLDIDSVYTGVAAIGGRVTATDVTVTRSTGSGIFARAVRGEDVESSDNGDGGFVLRPGGIRGSDVVASRNGLTGVDAWGRVGLRRLTAQDNGGRGRDYGLGVLADAIRLTDSVVTGNVYKGAEGDLLSTRPPHLTSTVCGRSVNVLDDLSWGVCADD